MTLQSTIFSPYIYSWAHNNNKNYKISNLNDVINLGIKNITLAFLNNNNYNEILDWKDEILKNNDKLNIILSIGGSNINYPNLNLSINQEANKLNNLLNNLNIKMIDLDIEGDYLNSDFKINNLINLIKILINIRNNDLWISLTLPVEFSNGLNNSSIKLINLFKLNKIKINLINLMLMDYYTPLDCLSWGDKNIEILKFTHNQLIKFGFNWNQIGICPMIGENDDGTKFTLNDWEKLLLFVNDKKIGLVTFWSINRDQKSNFLKINNNINTHSKCQDKDFQFTNKAIEILK